MAETNHELQLAVNMLHDPNIIKQMKKCYFNTELYQTFYRLMEGFKNEWYTPEDIKLRLRSTKIIYSPWNEEMIDDLLGMENDYMPTTHIKALQKEYVEERLAKASALGDWDEVTKQINNRMELMTEPEGSDLEGAAEEIMKDMNRGVVESLLVGNQALDDYLCGLRQGQLVVISGRPGMGKTACAINMAEDIYLNNFRQKPEITCEYFSLEMSKRELLERLLARDNKIKYWKIRKAQCTAEEKEKIRQTLEDYKKMNLKVRTQGVGNLNNIVACIKKQAIPGRYVAFVDHIGLISVDGAYSEYERITAVTNTLKQLAIELKITIVALSQLNRAVTQRDNKEPEASDLRGSGSIEQDADVIIILHADDEQLTEPIRQGIIKFAKNRAGKVGSMIYEFVPETMSTSFKRKMS